jgi:hypothetical protein
VASALAIAALAFAARCAFWPVEDFDAPRWTSGRKSSV